MISHACTQHTRHPPVCSPCFERSDMVRHGPTWSDMVRHSSGIAASHHLFPVSSTKMCFCLFLSFSVLLLSLSLSSPCTSLSLDILHFQTTIAKHITIASCIDPKTLSTLAVVRSVLYRKAVVESAKAEFQHHENLRVPIVWNKWIRL